MSIFDLDNIVPERPVIQKHEFKCYQCGFTNNFIKPQSFVDYKEVAKSYENKLNDMLHGINDCMEYAEHHYGLNPFKEKLIDDLKKLRDKYS